jgi:hypothetical protein
MKFLKRFLAMFDKQTDRPPEPPTQRGRVDPHNPDVIGNGAFKARAKPIPKIKYRVHRAATNTWEEFKDAQVKEGPH